MERDIEERLAWAWQAATDNPRPDDPMDPYNNEVIMPLAEFVEHPDVQDVLHNGATLQASSFLPPSTDASLALTAYHS